jgi:DNA-binding response OmpR family regulator
MTSQKHTVLIVDDDEKVRTVLRRCLEMEGYEILEAENSDQVRAAFDTNCIDLVTLDLGLGSENGLSIAADLKSKHDVAIIIVTGKGEVIDRVVGLELGADDYITKPFHVREVLARVRSVLRRTESNAGGKNNNNSEEAQNDYLLSFEGWSVNPSKLELLDTTGAVCDVTTSDFKLLMIFLERPKRVLSRDQIMNYVGGIEWTPLDRTIDNQVARLRKKIEQDPSDPQIIKTVRGIGYMFTSNVIKS